MARLRYLRRANADFVAIYKYIRSQGSSPTTAREFIRLLRSKCQALSDLPGVLGRPRPELMPDTRSFAFHGYIIIFRYLDDTFEVLRILEGHRDIEGIYDRDRPV